MVVYRPWGRSSGLPAPTLPTQRAVDSNGKCFFRLTATGTFGFSPDSLFKVAEGNYRKAGQIKMPKPPRKLRMIWDKKTAGRETNLLIRCLRDFCALFIYHNHLLGRSKAVRNPTGSTILRLLPIGHLSTQSDYCLWQSFALFCEGRLTCDVKYFEGCFLCFLALQTGLQVTYEWA